MSYHRESANNASVLASSTDDPSVSGAHVGVAAQAIADHVDPNDWKLEDLEAFLRLEEAKMPEPQLLLLAPKATSPHESAKESQSKLPKNRSSAIPSAIMNAIMPKEALAPLVLEAVHGFMFLVDVNNKFVMISENVDEFLGPGSQSHLAGKFIYHHIHPLDQARFSQATTQALEARAEARRDVGMRKSSVFTCRFAKQNAEPNDAERYMSLQVSAVAVKPPSVTIEGKDMSTCRLFCVARKVSLSERSQYFPVDMFSTKIDPECNLINVVDTSGMNTEQATNISKTLLNKTLSHFCHPSDQEILRGHLAKCMVEGRAVSQIYRMRLFDHAAEWVQVRSKSRLFKNESIGTHRPFIMSTHSIVGESEVRPSDMPKSASHLNVNNNNINNKLRSPPASSTSDMSSTAIEEKNLLLKQLLNVNFSRAEDDAKSTAISDATSRSDLSNSRILQLLSQSTNNVPPPVSSSSSGFSLSLSGATSSGSLKRPASTALDIDGSAPKISASSSATSSGSTTPTSSIPTVCKQNPALTNLLAKPLHNTSQIPPPVPKKWHQEPREKLPKGEVNLRMFLPPHPAERAAAFSTTASSTLAGEAVNKTSFAETTSSSSSSTSSPYTATINLNSPHLHHHASRPSLPLHSHGNHLLGDLEPSIESDPMLSEILDGVIDIQETSPSLPPNSSAADIERIEKFLTSSDNSYHHSASSTIYNRSHSVPHGAKRANGNIIQTIAGTNSPNLTVAANQNKNNGLMREQSNPVNLVPRMNELLQVVPPNITIPDCQELDSLVTLQQRRRSVSGGHAPIVSNFNHQQQQQLLRNHSQQQQLPIRTIFNQPQRQQQMLTSTSANNLLMQHLNSAPLNHQQNRPLPMTATSSYRHNAVSLSYGYGGTRHQLPNNARIRYQGRGSGPSGGDGSGNRPQLQQSENNEEGKSLLQQLLSE